MDLVDRDLEKAERHASPTRFSNFPEPEEPHPARRTQAAHKSETDGQVDAGQRPASIASAARVSSSSSSSVSTVSVSRRGVSRQATQPDNALERNETALSRIHTQRTQHSGTVGASIKSRQPTKSMPAFGANKPFPPQLPDREEYVVEFDGEHDPLHALNWPLKKKVLMAVMMAYTTFVSTFGSSIYSAALMPVARQYGVSAEVSTLGVSLFVLGFAFGPTVWGPLSELEGRRLPLVIAMFGFSLFETATATGKDLQTILICRFWAGFFGSCPLAVVAALFADMFDNRSRGLAVTGFAMVVFVGPLMAPFIGGFIVINPHMGWRWTQYIVAIMGYVAFGLNLFFLKETYPPAILVGKAAELRRRTKNWGIHAKQEEIEVDFRELVTKNFSRPLRMLVTEPIVLLVSVYMGFIYGLLYLFLTAYPIAFQRIRGYNPGAGGLPFFGLIVGELLGGLFVISMQPWYNRKLTANNEKPIPEWRLPPVIVGGVCFAIGLFWFGWTGYRANIHWAAPTLSGLMTGLGLLSIFLQSLNYIIDAYLMFAASALAANALLRSLAGAVFPLFATYMFDAMGLQWASTLLGCVALLLVPIPVVFYVYGAKIRQKSKFAPTPKPMIEE